MPLPPVVQKPISLLDALRQQIPDEQLAPALGMTASKLRVKALGTEAFSPAEIWRIVSVCQQTGRYNLLATHGVPPFPFDLRQNGSPEPFDVTFQPIKVATKLPSREQLASLPSTIAGFPVGFPIGVPASIITSNADWLKFYSERGFDILTYKTVRSRAHPAKPRPNWVFLADGQSVEPDSPRRIIGDLSHWPEDPRQASMANSFGIPSLEPSEWEEDIRGLRAAISPQQVLIVSIVGLDHEIEATMIADFVATAKLAAEAGAQIIEANFSCPNTPGDPAGDLYKDPARASRVAKALKEALGNTPLLIKIGYLPKDKLRDLVEAVAPFVNGVVAINTVSAHIVTSHGDITFPGRERAGISGHAIKPWAMEACKNLIEIRDSLGFNSQRLCVIGVGGVLTPSDVFDYLDIGVDAVETCTGAFLNPHLAVEARSPNLKYHISRDASEAAAGLVLQALGDKGGKLSIPELMTMSDLDYSVTRSAVRRLQERDEVDVTPLPLSDIELVTLRS